VNRPSHELCRRIARTIREQGLFRPGDTIIVAVSGGADSTALLDLLSKLPDFPLHPVAAHLNHCLRGPESDADEEFVRRLALRHAIPFESRRIDVKAVAMQQGLNLEDAGRRARIGFFEEMREKWQASAVVLAHHADDQAETVLMRLLRGAGPHGLTGMPYRNGRGFVRPMLEITRQEIEAYLAEQGLPWREDASNLDTSFLRNRIRNELLPLLEQYSPAVRSRLTTTAALLSDEDWLLQQLAEELTGQACSMEENTLVCDIRFLESQPRPLLRRVFRLTLERLAGNLDHFSHLHIAALEHLLDSPRPNATLNLPQGVTAVRAYGTLLLSRAGVAAPPDTTELIITEPGCHTLPGGDRLSLFPETSAPDFATLSSCSACFDLEKAPFPWLVRTFRAGDRMVPFGITGSKKIKEIFMEARIPLSRRRTIPLVFSGDTLIWVCGVRTSNLARVDDSSSRFIRAVFSAA
jgi:tRNA(Ile)-lysidine synthase